MFLPQEPGHVISLMGSGGKTSLMLAIACVYRESGQPVVLTTTTRCEILEDIPSFTFVELSDRTPPELPGLFFLFDHVDADNKWSGLTPAQVDGLGGLLPDRIVLAEVDGAGKFPMKLHRSGEPVWPGRTSLGIVVMGTRAVGSQTGDVLHRFGREAQSALGKLQPWTVWEWDHALALLQGEGGYLSRVPAEVPCVLALTGLDEQPDSVGLFDFVGRAMAHPRLPLVMFCSLGSETPLIRTACLEGSE